MMRKLRNVFRFITSLLLLFTLLFMQISIFTRSSFLNAEFYEKKLQNTEFYSQVSEEIRFGFKNLSMVTSVPEEVYNKSITDDYIKKLAINNIDNAAGYMKYKLELSNNKVNTAALSENINAYVNSYAQTNKLKVDDALKKQTEAMTEEAGKIVANHTALFNVSAVAQFKEFQTFRKGIFFIYNKLIFSIIFVAFLIALLFMLNPLRRRRTYLWTGSSFIAASIMSIIPMVMALVARVPYKLAIDTPYLKLALQEFTLGYIHQILTIGIIYFVLGVISVAVYLKLSLKEGGRPLG
jgi:hypothetical protein